MHKMTLINSTSNVLPDHPSSEMYTKHRCIFKCLCTFWGIHKNMRELCKLGSSINIPKKCCNMHNASPHCADQFCFVENASTQHISPHLQSSLLNYNDLTEILKCAFSAWLTWIAGNEWIRCSIFFYWNTVCKKDEWFSYFAPSVFFSVCMHTNIK